MKKLINWYLIKTYANINWLKMPPLPSPFVKQNYFKVLIYGIKYTKWLIDEQLWIRYVDMDFSIDSPNYSESHESQTPPSLPANTAITNDFS
jgi:hypothetical protein